MYGVFIFIMDSVEKKHIANRNAKTVLKIVIIIMLVILSIIALTISWVVAYWYCFDIAYDIYGPLAIYYSDRIAVCIKDEYVAKFESGEMTIDDFGNKNFLKLQLRDPVNNTYDLFLKRTGILQVKKAVVFCSKLDFLKAANIWRRTGHPGYCFYFSVVNGNGTVFMNFGVGTNNEKKFENSPANFSGYMVPDIIEFVAVPNEGYSVKEWTINGEKYAEKSTVFYLPKDLDIYLGDYVITVEFEPDN